MYNREKWKIIVAFLAPGLLLYSLFNVYPSIQGIIISLYRWSGLSGNMTFIGLENFATLWREFTDPIDFYNVRLYLAHNVFLFFFGLATIVLGLIAAAIINEKPWGFQFFRVTFFFPNVLAVPATAMLWSMTLNPIFGLVNTTLRAIGLDQFALSWLSLQYQWPLFKIGLYMVGFIGIWGGIGWFMLLFLAAIQNIPRELVEAAVIDGADRAQVFWSITIPLIWETIRTVLVFQVIGALSGFALPYVLFDRVSQKHADMVLSYYYWQAFQANNWGYAAAIVVVIFAITFVLTLTSYRFLNRESVQY